MFSDKEENRIMLNIGGIANLTYLPKSGDLNQTFSTDVGPGNTMMDALAYSANPHQPFDKDSLIARSGTVHKTLLKALHNNTFLNEDFPKTTGPELFNLGYLQQAKRLAKCDSLAINDCMATLNAFSAEVISKAIQKCPLPVNEMMVYSSGGGIHNPLLMDTIQQLHPSLVMRNTQDLGINPDAKEAILFALLANECLVGSDNTFKNSRTYLPNVSMGKISFPR